MVKVYLIIDPKTGYALYEDQQKFMGTYASISEASKVLDDIFKYYKVKTV